MGQNRPKVGGGARVEKCARATSSIHFFHVQYLTSQKDPYFTFSSPYVKLILQLIFPCTVPRDNESHLQKEPGSQDKGDFIFLEFSSQIHRERERHTLRDYIIGVDDYILYM